LTVFTPERGKLKLIAKGARKPSSRKSGHVELLSHGLFLVAVGRELDIITQAETLEAYLPLREDLLRMTYGHHVAELADAFAAERDENRHLFDLLKDALGWLCTAEDLRLAARYYELHLLALTGYQPQLYVCRDCQAVLPPEVNYLCAAEGGVLCARCGRERVGTTELSVNALKVLRFLQTRDWSTCHLLRLGPASHAEVERAMNQIITYHLERRLKSLGFLHRLRLAGEMGDRT
jgi:DNA repair protein RecO (recombination protein O)